MYIYCITNLVNNCNYVGQTIQTPKERWRQHLKDSQNPKMSISHAIKKYGIENFQFEVIDESAFDLDELNDLEEFYILFYDTFKGDGYNSTSGGDSFIMSDETKEKIRKSKLGKKASEETKLKMSMTRKGEDNHFYGKTHSDDTRKKMSLWQIGEGNHRYGKFGIQHNRSKKILQIDKTTHNEIACWFSLSDVQRELGITRQNISRVCRGKTKTAGGFKWKYL